MEPGKNVQTYGKMSEAKRQQSDQLIRENIAEGKIFHNEKHSVNPNPNDFGKVDASSNGQ